MRLFRAKIYDRITTAIIIKACYYVQGNFNLHPNFQQQFKGGTLLWFYAYIMTINTLYIPIFLQQMFEGYIGNPLARNEKKQCP